MAVGNNMIKQVVILWMVGPGLGYKIRCSDCWINDTMEYMMHCTCGGIGDPFSIILNKVICKGENHLLILANAGT